MRPEIVPATAELIARYYGDSSRPTMRAFVALLDGEPIGVGGVADHGVYQEVFSDIKPEMLRFPVLIYKAAKKVVSLIDRPAYASGDSNSDRFLKRLGFIELSEGVYQWPH